jgi:hypothetical protein
MHEGTSFAYETEHVHMPKAFGAQFAMSPQQEPRQEQASRPKLLGLLSYHYQCTAKGRFPSSGTGTSGIERLSLNLY